MDISEPIRAVNDNLRGRGLPGLGFEGFRRRGMDEAVLVQSALRGVGSAMSSTRWAMPDLPYLGSLNPANWPASSLRDALDTLLPTMDRDGGIRLPGVGYFTFNQDGLVSDLHGPPYLWQPIEGIAPLFLPFSNAYNREFGLQPENSSEEKSGLIE